MLPRIERRLSLDTIHSAIVRELDAKQKRYYNSFLVRVTTGYTTQTMTGTKLHLFYVIEHPGY